MDSEKMGTVSLEFAGSREKVLALLTEAKPLWANGRPLWEWLWKEAERIARGKILTPTQKLYLRVRVSRGLDLVLNAVDVAVEEVALPVGIRSVEELEAVSVRRAQPDA